jgi:ribose transport system permease protein
MSEITTKQTSKDESFGARETSAKRDLAVDMLIRLFAVAALFTVFSITARNFFTVRSVLTLALQTSTITLMGIGVTFTIITGGIDPFIATLGMMMVARGVALTITNANAWPAPEGFGELGNGTIFGTGPEFPGISYPLLIMIAVAFVFHFILAKTRLGRYTYAVGSNEEAARLAGIKIHQVKIINYIFCGLLTALVGIILASRMITSQPNSAIGYEMNAIAAAVIGGTSLMGGVGTVVGTVIGSFIIGILTVGLTMQGANYFMQQILIGLVVIGAVTVDRLRNRK